jgi:hypothetical protein
MTLGHRLFLVVLAVAAAPLVARAGPPYDTDDPEPVEYQHWEFYGATHTLVTAAGASGDAPHVEINYGVQPGMQLHVLAPFEYNHIRRGPTYFGGGDIELGVKLRLVPEADKVPMIGVFPLAEVPSGDAKHGLDTGYVQGFFPLWIQKSVGPWTTYGGGGYWVNPGRGNRDWVQAGWLVQRQMGKFISPGVEFFYESPQFVRGHDDWRFNVGLIADFTEHHHLLFSIGRSIVGGTLLENYLAYQLTL